MLSQAWPNEPYAENNVIFYVLSTHNSKTENFWGLNWSTEATIATVDVSFMFDGSRAGRRK
jgi:hypothetical protein